MMDVTKEFLSLFINPENIPDRFKDLVQLDVTDRSLQKPDKDLALGKYAQSMVT
ncbi:hypothetical protein DPMN_087793 [Dreissena polymorpha]|uniref:Uncharacterized protein n=1 Tax=Dreissena polymorpha TaxID=45954 RepID=A0A9D4KSZ6_DREPO|nr:hypothetical protein DPMN_087793 [Dreissena polymorpha]